MCERERERESERFREKERERNIREIKDGHFNQSERDGFLPENPARHDARHVPGDDPLHPGDIFNRVSFDRRNASVFENDVRDESGRRSVGGWRVVTD